MKFKSLFKRFCITITRPWPGDEKLGNPTDPEKRVTKEEVEKEIRDSLRKEK